MTRKRAQKYHRRTAHQAAMLREYESLGYSNAGLNWDGTLVLTKPCNKQTMTVISVFRSGNTDVRSCPVGQHPHTVSYGKRGAR